MKELIKAWEKEYKRLEDIKQTDLEHLKFVKINAKALQLKYCIKALKKQLLIHSVVVPKGTLCCNEGDEIMDENGSVICKVCKKVICI